MSVCMVCNKKVDLTDHLIRGYKILCNNCYGEETTGDFDFIKDDILYLTKKAGYLCKMLPFIIKKSIAKLPYYKLSNQKLKYVIFIFMEELLKNTKSINVKREFIKINNKKLYYNLNLDLKSYVARRFYYLDNNTDLGQLMLLICKKDDLIIDVGANIGQTSFMANAITGNVLSFEPVPNLIKKFNDNLKINKTGVVLEPYALSDKNGKSTITLSSNNDGSHSMNTNFITNGLNSYNKKINIITKTLDSYKLKNIKLIKIDVEGNEINVLKGMENTLKHVDNVVCETTPLNYKQVLEIFEKNNFVLIKEYGTYNNRLMNLLFKKRGENG